MESTLAVIATRNLHYLSEIEAFCESVFIPCERLKVLVFWSIICGYADLTALLAAGSEMSHMVLSHSLADRRGGGSPFGSECNQATVAEIKLTKQNNEPIKLLHSFLLTSENTCVGLEEEGLVSTKEFLIRFLSNMDSQSPAVEFFPP